MDLPFDLWHLAFANLVQRRAPPNFEIQTEVRLTIEPQRADMLLLRRTGVARQDGEAQVLRTLWPRLGLVTVLEYKSPADSSFRRGDLMRLWSYGGLYHTAHLGELPRPGDLTLALVIPSITPTLRDEIATMGWNYEALGGGYGRIDGAVYTILVVVTDEVSQSEKDEYLRLFSHRRAHQGQATRWLQQWMKETKMKDPDVEELPSFMEMFKKTVDAMTPEERFAGVPPEELISWLDRDHQALALPVEVLRAVSEEYIRSLSPEIQAEIRRRIQQGGH